MNGKVYKFLDLKEVNAPWMEGINEAIVRVAESGRYIGGDEVSRFEEALATSTGSGVSAAGVSNGLDALRLIFRAYIESGVMRPGDEVIVPSNTYIASILAVIDNGLVPVFVEPGIDTLNLDSSLIEEKISDRTRAILTVHLYGRVCYDEKMQAVADKYGLKIVEDNAQAIGAAYSDGRLTGALGDAAAFSFYPTKNIGALGDAGAVTSRDKELIAAIRAIANYGSDRRYHNIYQGLNCRLDPMQAAVLSFKLPFLAEECARRRSLASVYEKHISNPLVKKPLYSENGDMVWHQYILMTSERERFRDYLLENGVQTEVHYPLAPHRQPCISEYSQLSLPIADRIAAEVVSIPISSCTTAEDAVEISNIINEFSK